jgi:hypothetical protein
MGGRHLGVAGAFPSLCAGADEDGAARVEGWPRASRRRRTRSSFDVLTPLSGNLPAPLRTSSSCNSVTWAPTRV